MKIKEKILIMSTTNRSTHSEVFQGKDVLKIYSKFTGEYPCRCLVSIKLLSTLMKSDFGIGVLL